MADTGRLAEKIKGCLEKHRDQLAESQKLTDESMNELLKQREQFSAVAHRVLESTIHPRMEELKRHFNNAVITECHGDNDFHCACQFNHTPQFPATVTLDFGIVPGENSLIASVNVEILPVLMEFKRGEEKNFPLYDSDEAIGLWVEEKIIEFVENYLRLETHPLYQKDNLVTDPVCGMQISAVTAKSRIEWPGRTIYFCSEVCKEAFLKEQK